MGEGALAGAVVARHMALALQQPPGGEEAVDSHRSPGVDATGADSDFGAQAVPIAVGEPGADIDENRGRIHLPQESVRGLRVLGDDRVGVTAAEAMDVLDGGAEVFDRLPAERNSLRLALRRPWRVESPQHRPAVALVSSRLLSALKCLRRRQLLAPVEEPVEDRQDNQRQGGRG